jgi:hypothetical protein
MAVETSNPAIHVTGPIHHFIRTPAHNRYSGSTTTKIYYLGTCETQPQTKIARMTEDVFNDIGGRKIPFQQLFQGEIGVVGTLLTRFSKLAYSELRKAGGVDGAGTGAAGAGVGYESKYSRGGLIFGQYSVEMWQLYEYGAASNPNLTTGMPVGRYWPNATLGAHELVDSGTGTEKLLLVMNCYPLWLGTGGVGDKNRAFSLYSEASADFPADVVVTNIQ